MTLLSSLSSVLLTQLLYSFVATNARFRSLKQVC
ncbi:hypothetical protein Poly41_63850 [Novipirellula artificiosorum]|uniref:Uncharacterized protein n=1 Tax=Novipirellula artificiosorum TaxID=2528016 RepID=A0A5C6D5W0_9BACT|nr:hypothetical protein Poly41_63850 [Novipirellula artificiosorum]